jgi:hypothetical protein
MQKETSAGSDIAFFILFQAARRPRALSGFQGAPLFSVGDWVTPRFFETNYYLSFTTNPVLFAGRRPRCPALGLPVGAALGFATREMMVYQ